MYQLILCLHVCVAVLLVGLVLIQQGKGADMGASFGSGASNTVFGSQGTGGFLFRATAGLALVFFLTSITLSSLMSGSLLRTIQAVGPDAGVTLPGEDK